MWPGSASNPLRDLEIFTVMLSVLRVLTGYQITNVTRDPNSSVTMVIIHLPMSTCSSIAYTCSHGPISTWIMMGTYFAHAKSFVNLTWSCNRQRQYPGVTGSPLEWMWIRISKGWWDYCNHNPHFPRQSSNLESEGDSIFNYITKVWWQSLTTEGNMWPNEPVIYTEKRCQGTYDKIKGRKFL